MMSFESRTMARNRASLRSRRAVTWSTVRAARRPTTRVDTIARTTIARSRPLARMPSSLTSFLSVFGRPNLEPDGRSLQTGRSSDRRSGGAGAQMGVEHRPGGRSGSRGPGGDLLLQALGELGGRGVGGQGVEQRVGD